MTNVAMSSLEERIALAFTAETNSRAVAGLINEADAAAAESDDAAGCARTRALDPALTTTEVAIARREMEDAAFRRDRFQEALRRLSERLRERRRLIYEKAKARRDEVAAELGNTYQPLTAQLAELVARVEASDREIERINDSGLTDGRND